VSKRPIEEGRAAAGLLRPVCCRCFLASPLLLIYRLYDKNPCLPQPSRAPGRVNRTTALTLVLLLESVGHVAFRQS
jgi:hypothetical protein